MILSEEKISQVRVYLLEHRPTYLEGDFEAKWPDVMACLQNMDEDFIHQGAYTTILALALGGHPVEVFYHVCIDGFVYGYERSCGVKPNDSLILKYSGELAVIAHAATKSILGHELDSGETFFALGLSAVMRGYFAALE